MVSKALRAQLFAYAFGFGFGGFANAQAPEPTPYVAARAMIEEAQLSDVFEPVEDERISVRHIASGLVCHFSFNNIRAEVVIFSGQQRGDDVGCLHETDIRATTLYATRYDPPMSAEQALDSAIAGIRDRFDDEQPTPALATLQSDALPQPHVAHFLITVRGERWITSALVARSGDWVIKLRYSARAVEDDSLMRHQLEAGAIFTLALLEMRN
ncbi:MAG: hypothetical protein AB7Q23_17560 [Hyphomonadaceae bacterium]